MDTKEIHLKAMREDKDSYLDPLTGYTVFTASYLLKRGYCCSSGCRHCPYSVKVGHEIKDGL